jgi:hypothetical protein
LNDTVSGIFGPPDEYINSQADVGRKAYDKQRYGRPQFGFPDISSDQVDKDRLLNALLGAGAGAQAGAQGLSPLAALAMGAAGGIKSQNELNDLRTQRQMTQNKLTSEQLDLTPLAAISPGLADKFKTDYGIDVANMPLAHFKQIAPLLQSEVKSKEAQDKFNRDSEFRKEILNASPAMQSYWEQTLKMPPGQLASLKVAEEANLRAIQAAAEKGGASADKQWENLNKRTNPIVAPRGSLLNTAGQVNASADRSLVTLNKPIVTVQDMNGVAHDIARIMSNASATDKAAHEQNYGTVYSDLMGLVQKVTGRPQDAVPTKIVDEMRRKINEMKQVDNRIIYDNLRSAEVTYQGLKKSDPKRWKEYVDSITSTTDNPEVRGVPSKPKQIGRFNVVVE